MPKTAKTEKTLDEKRLDYIWGVRKKNFLYKKGRKTSGAFKFARMNQDWQSVRDLVDINLSASKTLWKRLPPVRCHGRLDDGERCALMTKRNYCCIKCWNTGFEDGQSVEEDWVECACGEKHKRWAECIKCYVCVE